MLVNYIAYRNKKGISFIVQSEDTFYLIERNMVLKIKEKVAQLIITSNKIIAKGVVMSLKRTEISVA